MGFFSLFSCFTWVVLFALGTYLPAQETDSEEEEPKTPIFLEDPAAILKHFPPFKAEPREPVLWDNGYFPCTDCHDGESQMTNPRVRIMEDEHEDIPLIHGKGRFWCLSCHDSEDRDALRTENGAKISFNQVYLLCGECHFQEQKDFFMGSHGKRLENWRGERVIKSCTGCHDPHDPKIKERDPVAKPEPRKGLTLPKTEHEGEAHAVWEEVAHD